MSNGTTDQDALLSRIQELEEKLEAMEKTNNHRDRQIASLSDAIDKLSKNSQTTGAAGGRPLSRR